MVRRLKTDGTVSKGVKESRVARPSKHKKGRGIEKNITRDNSNDYMVKYQFCKAIMLPCLRLDSRTNIPIWNHLDSWPHSAKSFALRAMAKAASIHNRV